MTIMPTFKGLITEDGMLKLIEYIKSLGRKTATMSTATPLPVETSASPQPQHAPPPLRARWLKAGWRKARRLRERFRLLPPHSRRGFNKVGSNRKFKKLSGTQA